METKTCTRCARTLPTSDFYWHKRDQRHRSWCWKCTSEMESARMRDRRIHDRAWARRMDERRRSAERLTPERKSARSAVAHLVRTGRIPRASSLPCHDCRNQAAEYDHWRGYEGAAKTDVQPVCRPCHGLRSRIRKEHARRPSSVAS